MGALNVECPKAHMIGTTAYVNVLEKQDGDRVRETYGHIY